MKTILVTGCSSGFGLEIARLFLDRGWNVVATMRTPGKDPLPPSDRLRVLALDVTDAESVRQAVEDAGPIDVLVNNAGIGLLGAVEGIPMATTREVFETNLFGTVALTQAFLPQFRERGSGVVVNVSSSVTLMPLPLLAIYSASKAAVNAFTESLALELAPFGVRASLVLPGRAPSTSFGENVRSQMRFVVPEPYADLTQRVFDGWAQQPADEVTRSEDVAEAVWRAANDPDAPMRLPAGADAVALANR